MVHSLMYHVHVCVHIKQLQKVIISINVSCFQSTWPHIGGHKQPRGSEPVNSLIKRSGAIFEREGDLFLLIIICYLKKKTVALF